MVSLVTVFAFDVLALDGADLRDRPLVERRAAVERILRPGDPVLRLVHSQRDAPCPDDGPGTTLPSAPVSTPSERVLPSSVLPFTGPTPQSVPGFRRETPFVLPWIGPMVMRLIDGQFR